MAQVFEFDRRKSELNRLKHGIDFVEAQSLWDDAEAVVLETYSSGETRHLLVGGMRGKLCTAAYTRREARIRIISVRRSRAEERRAYESQ